ncbi:hypothetical protein M9H77_14880 [Catharanthus roseus]|uniref:Uncharacterized protein n=1 Tax=Catharanthus roseus TaxID=4058 RepID=A0ACC0BPK8_CATRO|nr:hypothetical protein M9H77_00116 [Catharanthus roseus]KAI5674516.1 hypothetical protein M9H77_14880 [Catharanthus roseus]
MYTLHEAVWEKAGINNSILNSVHFICHRFDAKYAFAQLVASNVLIEILTYHHTRRCTTKNQAFTNGYYQRFSTPSVISDGSSTGYPFQWSNIKFVQKLWRKNSRRKITSNTDDNTCRIYRPFSKEIGNRPKDRLEAADMSSVIRQKFGPTDTPSMCHW